MTTALENFRAGPVRRVNLGRTTIAYHRFGRGPDLLLIHGWPLSGITFRGLVHELASSFTCWVPDLPGAGDSPWDPSTTEMFESFGDAMHRFVHAVGLSSFGVVGHDSGGTIARLVAARNPGRVFAVALTNTEVPGLAFPKVLGLLQRLAAVPGSSLLFSGLVRSRTFLRSRFGFGGTFANLDLLDGEFDETALAPLRRSTKNALRMLRRADLSITTRLGEVHEKIDAPLLAVWGDRDPFFPLEHVPPMIERWPGPARLEVLPGYKLLVHEEAPRAVARHMRPFLLKAAAAAPVLESA